MQDYQIVEIATLVHRKWADAFDTLKSVKEEENDGSPDWESFHDLRLQKAIIDEDVALNLKNDWIGENRDVLNRMMGLV